MGIDDFENKSGGNVDRLNLSRLEQEDDYQMVGK